MRYFLFTICLTITLTGIVNSQTPSFATKPARECDSQRKQIYFETKSGITYYYSESGYSNTTEFLANRSLSRIGTKGDSLSVCFKDVNGFIPFAFLIVNEIPRIIYIKPEKKKLQISYQLINETDLNPTGSLIPITTIPCESYLWPPDQQLVIKQSDNFSKSLLYCHYGKSNDFMTWTRSYNDQWDEITDTTFQLSQLFEKPKNKSNSPLMEIGNDGTIYLVTSSKYHTEQIWYGPKKRDMLIARISRNVITPLDYNFNVSVYHYTLKIRENTVVFAGVCCYGKTGVQSPKYGTFAIVFKGSDNVATNEFERSIELCYPEDSKHDQVLYLAFCGLIFTESNQFWLITQNYWQAEKEFVCQFFSAEGVLLNTSILYRKYSREGMGYGRIGIEMKQPFPSIGYSLYSLGESLQIFYHDNPKNNIKNNTSDCAELNFETGNFNLVMAVISPSGEIKKSLIHTFTNSEPQQQHNSVLVYPDNKNVFHLNCYKEEGKDWKQFIGTFTLSQN